MARMLFHALVASADTVTLDDREAHHVTRVLRLPAGSVLRLFDGRGTVAEGRLAAVGKRTVQVDILRRWHEPPATPAIIVCSAVPKGERLRWMVEKLTELAATALLPLETERSVVAPRSTKWDRMRQVSLEACKQSGNAHALQIRAEVPLRQAVMADPDTTGAADSTRRRFLLLCHPHPTAMPLCARLRALESEADAQEVDRLPLEVRVLIGPEGGFTDEEVDAAIAAGASPVTLGGTILRVETAAITATAALRLWFHGGENPSPR